MDEEGHDFRGRLQDVASFAQAVQYRGYSVFCRSWQGFVDNDCSQLLEELALLEVLSDDRVKWVPKLMAHAGIDQGQRVLLLPQLVLQNLVRDVLDLENQPVLEIGLLDLQVDILI